MAVSRVPSPGSPAGESEGVRRRRAGIDAAPPLGVLLKVDIEEHDGQLGTRYWARVRWYDPDTGRRRGLKRSHDSRAEAEAWVERMQGAARTGIDPGQTLATFVEGLGDRWARGIDKTSTYDPYNAGLRLRVIPALGHLPVVMITAGLVDRAIDGWEVQYGRSTVKNSVSALVLVLDEAVREGVINRNPAKDRARRRTMGIDTGNEIGANPRDLALPDVATLDLLVERAATAGKHQSYGDMVTILATTALRISEVSGLRVGDVDLERGLLAVNRQTYPGRGGLVDKQTKGRRRRTVPIIEPLRPTLERLTHGRAEGARLVTGPRGGVITTATLRDATGWDDLVSDLGLAGLVRHGLRHTALTWMADAGVELHLLQRVAGHQDPAVTARYLHPDHEAVLEAGRALSAWWAKQAADGAGGFEGRSAPTSTSGATASTSADPSDLDKLDQPRAPGFEGRSAPTSTNEASSSTDDGGVPKRDERGVGSGSGPSGRRLGVVKGRGLGA